MGRGRVSGSFPFGALRVRMTAETNNRNNGESNGNEQCKSWRTG